MPPLFTRMPDPLHLEFSLGADRYLLPVECIVEVLPVPALKALPGAPAGVVGVLNHRGRAVPVIDLARIALGRAAAERRATRLVLVHYPTRPAPRPLGVIVEQATDLVRLAARELAPAGAPGAAWLSGVAATGRGAAAGLTQRVEVEGLLPPELRAVLFEAAEGALADESSSEELR